VLLVATQLIGNRNIKAQVGILLATYCEAMNIERLIIEIENMKIEPQILVIDDCSPDGTYEIIKKLQKKYPNILLLIRPQKLGLGTAIKDGFEVFLSLPTPPAHIIVMDADYSHEPREILTFLANIQSDYGLIVGSRYCKNGKISGWPIGRRFVSRTANILAKAATGLKLSDCTSGYRCYSTVYIRTIIDKLHCTTYEIQIETARQAQLQKFKIKEIPIFFTNRKCGKSKLSITEISGFMLYILKTITYR
jgi:dolichol-phosphate mannosyltransferase